MQIFIKSSSEAKRPFVVESSTSILELKAKIEDEMKIPVSAQRLIYSGRVLKDSDTFGSIGAIEDVTIHLVKSIPVSGGSAASQTTVSAQATPQSTPSTTEPFSNNFCTKTNHYIATQTAGIPPFPGMFGSEFAAGGTDFSSAASSFNPAIMQAMLANPELLRQATQLLASNPDLLNMAMRGQQGGLCHIVRPYLGNNAFLQNPAAMQAAMQAFSDPTVMQQMMSIFANPTGKCIYVEHPYRIGIPPVTQMLVHLPSLLFPLKHHPHPR